MLRFVTYVLSNALGIWASARLVAGIHFHGDWKWLILAGAVLGLINFLVKPVVKVISLPLIWLTLGLFTIVINVLMLYLVARIVGALIIDTWIAAFWAAVVISAINFLTTSLVRESE
jgi:putative membrane protein